MTDEPGRPAPRVAVPPVYRWSRREAGVLTFGLRGRIVATVVVTVVPIWFFVNAGAYGLVGLLLWIFTALPLLLRDIWRRTRVLVTPATERDWTPPDLPAGYRPPERPGQQRW